MRRNDEIYIQNAERPWAIGDHYPLFARIEEETHRKVFQNRNEKWTGWKPTTEDQLMKFKKEVMKKRQYGRRSRNYTENIENAARKAVHRTKAQREEDMMSTREKVRLPEEAAARCTTKLKRRVLRKQARKARAEHLVKCSWN